VLVEVYREKDPSGGFRYVLKWTGETGRIVHVFGVYPFGG
jgi:hypothetical protein